MSATGQENVACRLMMSVVHLVQNGRRSRLTGERISGDQLLLLVRDSRPPAYVVKCECSFHGNDQQFATIAREPGGPAGLELCLVH